MMERLPKWLQNKWALAGVSFLISALICLLIYFLFLQGLLASVLTDHGARAMENEKYETAIAKYASALSLKKNREEIYLGYAKALIATQDFEKAAEILGQGIDRISGSEALYLCRVEALVKEGKIGDAAEFLDNIEDSYINKSLQEQRPADISYSPTKGKYDASQKVTFQVREGETIYYTLNGSVPTLSSTVYREPITVASSMTINAIAVSDDYMVSPLLEISYEINNENEAIEFEDYKIEKMVRASLKKPVGKIFAAQLAGVTELHNIDITGSIKSLKDLEFLPNITALTLDGELLINDYTPLAGLTELTYLSMANCALSAGDLTSVNACTKLSQLNLQGNEISSFSNLSDLTELEYLNAAENDLDALGTLSPLKKLTYLDLSRNRIRDLSPLSDLIKLQSLLLAGNSSDLDLTPLAKLKKLVELNLSKTYPADLQALEKLPELAAINVSDCGLDSLSDFNEFKALCCITANRNEITSLSSFNGKVQELYLNENPLSDLSPLKKQTGLVYLEIADTDVSNLSPLSGLKTLESLNIIGTKVSDVSILKGCPALRTLYCNSDCATNALPAKIEILHE